MEEFKEKWWGCVLNQEGVRLLFLWMMVYNELEGRTEGGRKNADNIGIFSVCITDSSELFFM